jgi:SAM-dependent methyltransferase
LKLKAIGETMLPARLRSLIKKILRLGKRKPPVIRPTALQEEIDFWRNWIVTGGSKWPEDFHERFNPDQPIQDHVAEYIGRVQEENVHILDVGSGPLTKLGKKHPSKQFVITATDLLANEYDQLLAELDVKPLVRTIYADAERLEEQFGQNTFDIVHGQNCIDHTAQPLRAIEQMVKVTKPQGFVVLYHAENEGQREGYGQLHQWDFTCEHGAFVIGDRYGQKTNVTEMLAASCEVECRLEGEAVLAAMCKK